MNKNISSILVPLLAGVAAALLTVYTLPQVEYPDLRVPPQTVQSPLTMTVAHGTNVVELHATGGYQRYAERVCRWCGSTKDLQVHHRIPQHVILQMYARGEITLQRAKDLLDNDRTNFVTFCQRCHFVVGHQCKWANDVTNLNDVLRAAGKD